MAGQRLSDYGLYVGVQPATSFGESAFPAPKIGDGWWPLPSRLL